MTQLATRIKIRSATKLSISYKSTSVEEKAACAEAIIVTDPRFVIKGFNDAAAEVYGFSAAVTRGQKLFHLVRFEMIGFSRSVVVKTLFDTGYWKGDILYKNGNNRIKFNACCNVIKDEQGVATSFIIITRYIFEEPPQKKEEPVIENKYQTLVDSFPEGLILINENGTIGAANKKAGEILGLTENEMTGRVLNSPAWKKFKENGSEFPRSEYPAFITLQTGLEQHDVIMRMEHKNGKKIWVSVSSKGIFDHDKALPTSAVVSIVDITEVRERNNRFFETGALFGSFVHNSPILGWIYDKAGTLIYGNNLFLKNLGLKSADVGKNISIFTKSDSLLETIVNRIKAVLQNGKPIIVEDAITGRDGITRYYLSYWFLITIRNKKLVGGQAIEITNKKRAQAEIDKMYERYRFAINAGADAIWDMDIATGNIYLSDTFSVFSGYKNTGVTASQEWLLEKIHPQDKNRVKSNVQHCLDNHVTNWENEYRFRISDGSYRNLLDKAHAIYKGGKPTRVIGSMQDITERKRLEAQLLKEQVQKQKMINQGIIKAQEKERTRISGELHDNVNQLLMSAKLHICVAKNGGEGQISLLEKANKYLLMAVAEIRNLSKNLTSDIVSNIGLQKSITDIAATMLLLKNTRIHTCIPDVIVDKLSNEQQLMIYRIVQEQSNNILKYAEATEVVISLKEINQSVELIISDNGKGFDKKEQKATGIGFINIFNRVDAYNGKVEIVTSPGNGCALLISFPIRES